jgi:hypothetical protein
MMERKNVVFIKTTTGYYRNSCWMAGVRLTPEPDHCIICMNSNLFKCAYEIKMSLLQRMWDACYMLIKDVSEDDFD